MGRYLPWRDGPARPRKKLKIENQIEAKSRKHEEENFREDEYMRDGLANDDYYIMVEDELLQVAHSYTKKLHSAELSRLQEQLALRKAQKRESQGSQPKIPVSMPKQQQIVMHKRIQDAAVKPKARKLGLAAPYDTDEPYSPQFSSRSLSRLMSNSGQRLDASLPTALTLKTIKPSTRAAAGYTKASHKLSSSQTSPTLQRYASRLVEDDEEESEDEDDLDVIPQKKEKTLQVESSRTKFRPESITSTPRSMNTGMTADRPTSPSTIKNESKSSVSFKPTALSASKSIATTSNWKPIKNTRPKLILTDSDDDYADPEQAERWRRRREAAEARKSAANS